MDRVESLEQFQEVLDGKAEAYIWRGDKCPWVEIVIVDPGTEVDAGSHNMDPSIVREYGVYFDGIMGLEEVAERLNTLRNAPEHS